MKYDFKIVINSGIIGNGAGCGIDTAVDTRRV